VDFYQPFSGRSSGFSMRTAAWRRAAALVAAIALAFAPAVAEDPADADADPAASGTGTLVVRVRVGRGLDVSLEGARVLAFHIGEQKVFASDPVGRKGEAQITGLPRGYFDLAVEVGEDVYVASDVVHLPPAGRVLLDLELGEFPPTVPADRRRFAGLDREGEGQAETSRRLRGREFWRSPKGIAILAGGGGAVLLGIALSGSDDEVQASPFVP